MFNEVDKNGPDGERATTRKAQVVKAPRLSWKGWYHSFTAKLRIGLFFPKISNYISEERPK
jgi:hypothetical protein